MLAAFLVQTPHTRVLALEQPDIAAILVRLHRGTRTIVRRRRIMMSCLAWMTFDNYASEEKCNVLICYKSQSESEEDTGPIRGQIGLLLRRSAVRAEIQVAP